VRDQELLPELSVRVAGRVAHHEPAERLAEERQAHQAEQKGSVARHPGGAPTSTSLRRALARRARSRASTGRQSTRWDVGRRELERVEDVAKERARVLE
jgi:hypothetical protein